MLITVFMSWFCLFLLAGVEGENGITICYVYNFKRVSVGLV